MWGRCGFGVYGHVQFAVFSQVKKEHLKGNLNNNDDLRGKL
jgi:hypothetical protein